MWIDRTKLQITYLKVTKLSYKYLRFLLFKGSEPEHRDPKELRAATAQSQCGV